MNFGKEASELIERLQCADGVIVTRQKITEDFAKRIYELGVEHGKERAALYAADEIGSERLALEIRQLPSCF